MQYLKFPLQVGADGLTASSGYAQHVLELIEELLFTSPGQRVNRPNFGVGLAELVFGPNDPEIATATQFLIQNALQTWLSEYIRVNAVTVDAVVSSLQITVEYTIFATGDQ